MGEENTTNWRLQHIEIKTDKLEANDEKFLEKMTTMEKANDRMESNVKIILETYEIAKKSLIGFIILNVLGMIWAMWSKLPK